MVVKKRIEEELKCPLSVFDVPANGSCQFFAVIKGFKHYDPAQLDECTFVPDEQRVLQLRHQVAKHLLQNAHRNMACPDGEMTVAELLDVIRGRCLRHQGTHAEAGHLPSRPHP
eukprot:1939591-Pleurochrysis_carterae.AAC.1